MKTIILNGGKYTVLVPEGIRDWTAEGFRALRLGREWRTLTGDGLALSMAYRILKLEDALRTIKERAGNGGRRLETALDACDDIEALAKRAIDGEE